MLGSRYLPSGRTRRGKMQRLVGRVELMGHFHAGVKLNGGVSDALTVKVVMVACKHGKLDQ